MSTPRIDIRPDHWKIVRDILHKHVPQYEVWAFGSRAKWTAKDYSDLDLCVISDKPLSLSVSAALADDFSESDLPWKVDVVDWATTAESFRKIIERDKVVVQKRAGLVDALFAIPANWESTTLGEVCKRGGGDVQTGPFGSQLHAADYVANGIPSIMPQNIGENRISEDGIARITDEDAQRLSRYLVRAGDIVYSRRGDVERRALIREHEEGWLCGTGCLRVRFGKGVVHPLYAAHYLGHPLVREWIVRHAHGATMPNLNTSILSALPFVLPTLDEQRAIAHILGTLDDKIELNRRMNETLDAIARAMFKSWFVDFDPVRAKMNGEPPESICQRLGLTPDLLALFPDRLVDSELGEIPEGWNVESVYKISSVIYGAPFASSKFNTDGIGVPLIRIRDLKDEAPGVHTEEVHPKGYMVRAGDIVVGMDGEFRAYLWGGEDAWLNQRVCVFKPSEGYSAPFIHNCITPCLAHVEETETATTVIHLGKNDIDRFKIIDPTKKVLEAFNAVTMPLYDQIISNKKELCVLAEIRDTLLPKLLSGELRVNEMERLNEEVSA